MVNQVDVNDLLQAFEAARAELGEQASVRQVLAFVTERLGLEIDEEQVVAYIAAHPFRE